MNACPADCYLFISKWYDHWMKGIDTGITEEPPMKLNILGRGYRYEHEYPSYILMPYIPETPGELWLQPMVDDDIVMGGSSKGGTH